MPKDLPKRLGNRVRELRVRAGLTQSRLADRVDISHEFMSRLERGIKAPSLETAKKIADALGISVAELFDFGCASAGEKEELLRGLTSLLATESMPKIKLVVELAKTVVRT